VAISTYSELQDAVKAWLARDGDADMLTRVPEFIALVEAQFNRDVRHRSMEIRGLLVPTAGNAFVTLPSDYREARSLVVQSNPLSTLSYVTPQQMDTNWPNAATGIPIEYTIVGNEIKLGVIPNSATAIEITYYQTIPALGTATPSNWMLSDHPDLYLYGSLLQAAPYLKNNADIPVWGAFYTRGMEGLKQDATRSAFNGGPLSAKVAVFTA